MVKVEEDKRGTNKSIELKTLTLLLKLIFFTLKLCRLFFKKLLQFIVIDNDLK